MGLLGLTLLSCGVSAHDPMIRGLAANLRQQAPQLNQTYKVSLALLFFDRLKNGSDRVLIQSLALRLVAGQSGRGDWGYYCPPLNSTQQQLLRAYLWTGAALVLDTPGPAPGPFDSPPSLLELALARPGVRPKTGRFVLADNSNTQFALLALWAARRHGASVGPALARVARHFRTTQRSEGSWAYRGEGNQSRPSNSCAGLMGLAVEHGLRHWSGGKIRDAAMQKGLRYLGNTLAQARPNRSPTWRGFSGVECNDDLYFFWSLERMALIYGLRVIGATEWYPWAAERIVNAQQADGSWQNTYGASVDTCFALLVLRRTNFASDLTTALRGRVPGQDPLPSTTSRPGATPPLSTTDKPGAGKLGSATRKDPEELNGSAVEGSPPM
jgi:hypothetical protein